MYKIGDFSKVTNTSVETLKYYDEIDLLKPSYEALYTKCRYYEKEQIKIVNMINEFLNIGLSLETIKLYLKTKDNNDLFKNITDDDLICKINSIILSATDIKKYKIEEYDYKKYVEINGIIVSNCPQALEIRDYNAKYFIIETDEFIDDFCIFNKENIITLDNRFLKNEELMNSIITYLKEKYDLKYLTFMVISLDTNTTDYLLTKYPNNQVSNIKQGKYMFNKIKVNI